MSDVPPELVSDILLRLPAVSLLRFRAVCKSWKSIIDDPSFVRSHAKEQRSSTTLLLKHSNGSLFTFSWDSLTYDGHSCQTIDVTPIRKFIRNRASGSSSPFAAAPCNGLFLVFKRQKAWLIANPLTGDLHLLPPVEPEFDSHFSTYGLGYDIAADDYKVVKIDQFNYVTLVYSMKHNSWKRIKDFPGNHVCLRPGICLHGTLYWKLWDCIIALDLASEDYRRLPLPPFRNVFVHPSLEVIGGFLACSDSPKLGGLNVWVMKKTGVWTELFWFEKQFDSNTMGWDRRVIAYWESKGQMLTHERKGCFLWWDIVNQTVKKVTISGVVGPGDFCAAVWTGSLFRLDRNVDGGAMVGVKRKSNSYSSRLKMSVTVSDVKLHLDSESSNGLKKGNMEDD